MPAAGVAYLERYKEEAVYPEDESSRLDRNGGICLSPLHGLASQETAKFTVTAIRTPELTIFFSHFYSTVHINIFPSTRLAHCLVLFEALFFQCVLNVPPFSSA